VFFSEHNIVAVVPYGTAGQLIATA